MLDNTINKVAEEVLSPEELEERQLKIQVSSDLVNNCFDIYHTETKKN